MLHTGQHYDDDLSRIFFSELNIREPDHILDTGRSSRNQFEQLSYLSREVIPLIRQERIDPNIIIFLGDSHSAMVSAPLFKEGYTIGHIEGGMRSYDRRMPEEVNRVICDYVSDLVFVYTPLYKERLLMENKDPDAVHVVGNTIVEVVNEHMPTGRKAKDYILADIHRNENLSNPEQYRHILEYLDKLGDRTGLPVRLVRFNRAVRLAEKHALYHQLRNVELVGPFGFLDYLALQYNAYGVVSDSGTSQEECPLLRVPVAVPRNSTERPESMEFGNSILVGETVPVDEMTERTLEFFENYSITGEDIKWLGDGTTSSRIVDILRTHFS
jgi:UDP-N-acetylglucosamine 2-epimerase (non-hydrolysing)